MLLYLVWWRVVFVLLRQRPPSLVGSYPLSPFPTLFRSGPFSCARLARMSPSHPAYPPRARSLTGVLNDALAAVAGGSGTLPPARSAVVFVLDGLGAHNLAGRRGHARYLSSLSSRSAVARDRKSTRLNSSH